MSGQWQETPLNKALKAAVHSSSLGKKYVGSRSDCLGDTLTHARLKHSKPQSQGLSVIELRNWHSSWRLPKIKRGCGLVVGALKKKFSKMWQAWQVPQIFAPDGVEAKTLASQGTKTNPEKNLRQNTLEKSIRKLLGREQCCENSRIPKRQHSRPSHEVPGTVGYPLQGFVYSEPDHGFWKKINSIPQ